MGYGRQPSASRKWHQFVFINPRGFQLAKFAWGDHATAPISVAHRDYFRQAMRQETGCMLPSPGASPTLQAASTARAETQSERPCDRFMGAVEVVRAGTSGEIITVMSRPAFANGQLPVGVATLSTQPSWLTDKLLPRGMQFAVLDSRGRVALHSDNNAQHGHVIFDDLDDPQGLRSLLESRVTRHLDVKYQGESTRLTARYLPGPDWHLLTLMPLSQLDAAMADTVVLSFMGLACYLFVVCLLLLAFVIAKLAIHRAQNNPGHCVWFRPEAHYATSYRAIGGLVLLLGLVALALAFVAPLPVALAVLLGATGIGLWRPQLKPKPKFDESAQSNTPTPKASTWKEWRQGLAASYTSWLFSLVIVVVILPAGLWFVESYKHVAANLLRSDLAHYERALHYAPDCLSELGGPNCPQVIPRSDIQAFEAEPSDETSKSGESSGRPGATLGSCLLGPVPCLVGLVHWFGLQQFADCLLHESVQSQVSQSEACGQKLGTNAVGMLALGDTRLLCGEVPRLASISGRGWAWALTSLALAALLAVGFFVAYGSCRRVFFMNVLQRLAKPPDLHALVRKHRLVLLKGDGTRPDWATDFANYGAGGVEAFYIANIDTVLENVELHEKLDRAIRDGHRILAFASNAPHDGADEQPERRKKHLATLSRFHEALAEVQPDDTLNAPEGVSEAYLIHLWEQLPRPQQRLLGQLAVHGFVTPNHNNDDHLERLALRGILCSDSLTFRNRRFAGFVRAQVPGAELAKWESASGPWEKLRAPLYTAVAATCVAVGFSAPEVAFTGALAPALAASLPAFLRLMGSVALNR